MTEPQRNPGRLAALVAPRLAELVKAARRHEKTFGRGALVISAGGTCNLPDTEPSPAGTPVCFLPRDGSAVRSEILALLDGYDRRTQFVVMAAFKDGGLEFACLDARSKNGHAKL